MAVDIVMPQMGESIFEGTITKWLKKPGDKVERDEPLFEISTDKVDAEIPSPSAGVLKEIKVGEGKTVPIQTVVGVIDAAGGAAQAAAPAPAPAAKAPNRRSLRSRSATSCKARSCAATSTACRCETGCASRTSRSRSRRRAHPQFAARSPHGEGTRRRSLDGARHRHGRPHQQTRLRSASRQRRVCQRSSEADRAGRGRRLRAAAGLDDVDAVLCAAASAATTSAAAPGASAGSAAASTMGGQHHVAFETAVPRERMYFGNYEVQPMTIMRQRIAEHMIASKHVSPHVYSVDEIDMTKVAAIRAKSRDEFEKRYETKLTYMPFFVKAAVAGLRAYPTMNASLDGTNVVLHKEINIGMAVALDWGLIVPVIKNADEKNILGIQRNLNDLAERARSKKLKPEEVQESTFSITNPGVFGGLFGLPVISQPNVGILGLGAIEKRPVVINDSIAIRSMCYVTLSYDHRVVDGAVAHQFLHKVKDTLENWSESVL